MTVQKQKITLKFLFNQANIDTLSYIAVAAGSGHILQKSPNKMLNVTTQKKC